MTRTPLWPGLAMFLLGLQGCDPEVIVYEKEGSKRDLGLPCVIDTECNSTRCQAGVCGVNQCDSDNDCRADEICNLITHMCEPVANFACQAGQAPIVQIDVTAFDFGTVVVGTVSETAIHVNNIGDCLLTIDQAMLDPGGAAEITCTNCAAADYPKSVPPGHGIDVQLAFAPQLEQRYSASLAVRTDDPSAQDGLFHVALNGEGLGHPRMTIDPNLVDFGNVAPNDPAVSKQITVTNVLAGTLTITRVFVDPPSLTSSVTVSPAVGPTDAAINLAANQSQVFTVTYDPSTLAATDAFLYIFSNDTSHTCAVDVNHTPGVGCVELTGDSRGPPIIQVSHTTIDFGQLNLGQSAAEMVTISNNGASDLTILVSMTVLSSTDFRYSPPSTTTIPPGSSAFLNVFYEAAQLNQVTGTLQIQSNDPTAPLKNVSLTGFGMSPYNNDVLKVEMNFENGDSGFFGNDFRDVNLSLESPFGELVDKEHPNPDWSHGATDNQRNWGHPQWSAIGANQEPERTILFDAHEDAYGTFQACVDYREDCAMIPTDILAGLLGITVSALLSGLTEGILSPDAGDVSEFIANNCWDHAGTSAVIATYVNGEQVAQTPVSLGSKGDRACPVTIQRINGLYCVSGAGQAGCP